MNEERALPSAPGSEDELFRLFKRIIYLHREFQAS